MSTQTFKYVLLCFYCRGETYYSNARPEPYTIVRTNDWYGPDGKSPKSGPPPLCRHCSREVRAMTALVVLMSEHRPDANFPSSS